MCSSVCYIEDLGLLQRSSLEFSAVTTEQFALCHVMDTTHNGVIEKTNPTHSSFFSVRMSIVIYSFT